ncbi:MAG: hypothetical protein FIB01_06880 [Gemmatimonadetes bacterium]|nr:hypothetical protein [Gemmatimonadota bacterium]
MMFQASKPRYAATNDAVNIQFAGFPGNAEDCITIAPPDAPPEQWVRQWCTDGLRAGTVAWADLTPGIYEARAHFDWTRQRGAIRARVYFQVGDVGGVGLPPQPTAPVSVPVPTQPPPTPPATVPTAPPTQPTPPAPAPPPAGGAAGANPITGFGYVDGTEDRVAEYDRGSPNGTPDAHFRLVLDAGTVAVKSIGVFSTDEAGTQRGDTRWCTDRAGGGWMAGVFRGGVQLNPSYVVSLGTFSGRTVLDVYGERASLVTPGSFYVVVVTLSDGRELTRTTRAGEPPPDAVGALPAAPTGAPAIAAFGFVDRSEDRIAEWDRGRPNGTPDAHFRLVLDGNGNTFRSIDVVASDAQGGSRLNTHWSTDQTHGNWMLGVFRDGQQLAPSYIPVLGRIDGRVTFELYGESAREAPDGAWFVVVVQLLDGREMTRVARVGDPFSSPGAIAAPIMPPPTVPAAPPPPTATAGATGIVDITLVGRTEDRVSHGDAQPNGARDSHYRLTVDLNGEEVRWIRVFESNPDGSTIGSGFWRTDSTGNSNWWLGVAANGQLLATTFKDSLGRMQGRTVLDLYADGADSYARPGQWLVFAITLGDGRELRKQLRAPQ